ncbi:hypothetical protein D347_01055 [Enterococcus faecalis LA3B-2]|nr:hypothetical protein D347_01055 [Enterococcus faecalis LA3B-2]
MYQWFITINKLFLMKNHAKKESVFLLLVDSKLFAKLGKVNV